MSSVPLVSVVIINKNDAGIAETLAALQTQTMTDFETVVVDASKHALDHIRADYPDVVWVDYAGRSDKGITIADQRNVGVARAAAPIIAFTDASCIPVVSWLEALTEPIRSGEQEVTVGRTTGGGTGAVYTPIAVEAEYVYEAPTINLAFTKAVFDEVGGFDESFDYGSDVDFTWRLRQTGHRLKVTPTAVVSHDWGDGAMFLTRSFRYGAARARLYRKHPREISRGLREDPVVFAYPVMLLLLPLSLARRGRWIPLLLAIPVWRSRRDPRPLMGLVNKFVFAAGALRECARPAPERV